MENWEMVVVIRCASVRSPEYGYYIADHVNRTVRWVHEGPQEVLSPEDSKFNLSSLNILTQDWTQLKFVGAPSTGSTSTPSPLTAFVPVTT
jgi:hypothetical protein